MVSITTLSKPNAWFTSCDLLKKLYLCGVNYNEQYDFDLRRVVVICLKSCIFVVSITTVTVNHALYFEL